MKAWTIDAADYSLYRADQDARKKQDNKDFQETIGRTFRQPDSARIFSFLAQYGSLTSDQLAALLKQTKLCRASSHPSMKELKDCGYLETRTHRYLGRVYFLSDKAFLDPKTDRPQPGDVDREELFAAMTLLPGVGQRHRKKALVNTGRSNVERLKKQKIKKKRRRNNRCHCKRNQTAVFRNEDLMYKVSEFLDTETLLFGLAAVSKTTMRPHITHELAVRCAIATRKGRRRLQDLVDLIRNDGIYTPSPMRILRLATGKRCELCNVTLTNKINDLGLFLCRWCTSKIIIEARSPVGPAKKDLHSILKNLSLQRGIVYAGLATIVRQGPHRIYVYARSAPFVDSAGEKVGPLLPHLMTNPITASSSKSSLSSDDLFNAIYSRAAQLDCLRYEQWVHNREARDSISLRFPAKVIAAPNSANCLTSGELFFTSLLQESRAKDHHRPKISAILDAYERFRPRIQIYHHFGIVDHSGPFFGGKRSMWNVLVEWENGERTWRPLTDFAEDDFESCASYARDHGLLDTKGWRRFR